MSNDSVGSIGRHEGIYGHILSRVVDVRAGQGCFTHDPSASTSPDQAFGTEMFSALAMNFFPVAV